MRLIFWMAALAALVVAIVSNPYVTGVAGLLLQKGPQDEAYFVADASLWNIEEHRSLASDLDGGVLRRVPNSSSMNSHQFDPVPRILDRGSGLVLKATSFRDINAPVETAKFSFLVLYLPADPGDRPMNMRFSGGQTANGAMLLVGYASMRTGHNTYGYPVAGIVRVWRTGPDAIEADFDVRYRCASYVGGNGAPEGWLADEDCPQNLFPARIRYGPKPAGAL